MQVVFSKFRDLTRFELVVALTQQLDGGGHGHPKRNRVLLVIFFARLRTEKLIWPCLPGRRDERRRGSTSPGLTIHVVVKFATPC